MAYFYIYFYDDHAGMGLCFIGKRKFSPFISQYLPDQVGLVKSIETDEIIGEHRGLHHYTLGQRISPINRQPRFRPSKPLFIAKKDQIENIIYVVQIRIFSAFIHFFLFLTGRRPEPIIPLFSPSLSRQVARIGSTKYHWHWNRLESIIVTFAFNTNITRWQFISHSPMKIHFVFPCPFRFDPFAQDK